MLQEFRIGIDASEVKSKKDINKIKKILENYWDADYEVYQNNELKTFGIYGSSDNYLGDYPDNFVRNLKEEIWNKVKYFVHINITIICLEHLPCDTFDFTEDDYKDFIEGNEEVD